MAKHVVIGSGPVGTATARQLADMGHEVVLGSRSGEGPAIAGVRRVAIDAADAEVLIGAAQGAEVLYNCVNPPTYDVWPTWWPPVADAFLAAAERSGAVLATASCLYAYGQVEGPMIEGMPDAATGAKGRVRAIMWADAKAAHDAGRVRAVEVRGSDYLGPGVANAHLPVVLPKALVGKAVRVFGAADQPHTWTDVRDMARALIVTAENPSAHGRVWHAPSNAALTQTEAIAAVCEVVGRSPGRVRVWPAIMLSLGGVFMPFLREMRETLHQFEKPFVMDSSAIERDLGISATPWDQVCLATAIQGGVDVSTVGA